MVLIQIIFYFSVFIIFYSYAGYGILVWAWLRLRRLFHKQPPPQAPSYPPVTLVVAAYNEEEFIESKIQNSLSLDYPEGLLKIIFVTDGSTDASPQIVSRYGSLQLLHSNDRRGKVAAMHRAMSFIETPIVIFSDANTLLNRESVKNIVRHYSDEKVGGVAGEKKIMQISGEGAASAGEGLYWKYESFLKKLDSEFYSVVGAAGELFSVRKELYEHPGDNILLDDFIISMRVCQKGYQVRYEPGAYAMESPSASLAEEKKRKIRISAGAFQSMVILADLLNIFKYPRLAFQYISHRVLRWTLCPLLLPLALLTNIALVVAEEGVFYTITLACQTLFYFFAFLGWLLSSTKTRIGFLYAPYYLLFINYSLYAGFVRYWKGNQSVLWEKASRRKYT